MSAIQDQIEERLAELEPDVEVILVDVLSGGTVRLFVDHPDGVTLDLCARVSDALAFVREHHALEVSSPGPRRPLTKPDHFRRYLGARVRVRTRASHAGRSRFTGELVGASDTEVTVAADGGVVSLTYDDIQRSNLLGE